MARAHLVKTFALGCGQDELTEFCGVRADDLVRVALYSILPQDIVLFRIVCRQTREAQIAAAGPPTTATKQAAAYVSPCPWICETRVADADGCVGNITNLHASETGEPNITQ